MKDKAPSRKTEERSFLERLLKPVIVLVILVAVVWSTATYYNTKGEAKRVLREAKDIQLTIRYLSNESYATDKWIRDNSRKSGLASWAEKEIKELSGHSGEVYLIYQNPDNYLEMEIWYMKDDFTAQLSCDGSENLTYTVYHNDKVILE